MTNRYHRMEDGYSHMTCHSQAGFCLTHLASSYLGERISKIKPLSERQRCEVTFSNRGAEV